MRDGVRVLPDRQDGDRPQPYRGEIAGQVRVLARELDLLSSRFNIVLMGMGEPLHNYDETMKALRILADEHGLAVSPRRITLSTVGVLPKLERLATEALMPNLAISLHSTTEDQRDRLVPVNRKYGLKDLLDACRRFPLKRRSRITFEYVLLNEVNDTRKTRGGWSSCWPGSRRRSICCRSTRRPAFPSSARPTIASTASLASSPIAASASRCASREGATSARPAAS